MSNLPTAEYPAYRDGDAGTLVPVPIADLSRAELLARYRKLTTAVLLPQSSIAALGEIRRVREALGALKEAQQ